MTSEGKVQAHFFNSNGFLLYECVQYMLFLCLKYCKSKLKLSAHIDLILNVRVIDVILDWPET